MRLIPVTEAERREEFLGKILRPPPDGPHHALSQQQPSARPRAAEIVGRMVGVVLEHPPSFENRVEMLQRVSALLTEKRSLRRGCEEGLGNPDYASRRSRTRDTVKLTVCVCVSVPAVTAQRLQCDEN